MNDIGLQNMPLCLFAYKVELFPSVTMSLEKYVFYVFLSKTAQSLSCLSLEYSVFYVFLSKENSLSV